MNKYKYLASNLAIFALGNLVSKLFVFLLLGVFTKYLTPSEFGDAELIITTITLFVPIFTLSIADATLKYLLQIDKPDAVITNGFIITTMGSIIFLIILPLFQFYEPIEKYSFYIFVLYSLCSYEQLFFCVNKGLENVKICGLNAIVSVSVLIIGSWLFLYELHLGVKGYLISIALSHFICSLYLFLFGRNYKYIRIKHLSRTLLINMLQYSIPFMPSAIAWWINSLSSRYLITILLGAAANGLFSVAAKIPNVISIFTTIFYQAWQISGIKEYNESDYSKFYSTIFNAFYSFIVMLGGLIIVFMPIIATFLFNGDFYEAWKYVPILVIAAIFSGLSGILSPAFQAANKTKVLMVSTLLGTIVNILLNLLLLNYYGVYGASIATLVSFVVVFLFRLYLLNRFVKIKIRLLSSILSVILLVFESVFMLLDDNFRIISYLICLVLFFINIYQFRVYVKPVYERIKSSIK